MTIVKTSAKGQVVIPAPIREKLHICSGSLVSIRLVDDQRAILASVPQNPVKALRGCLKGGRSLTQELLRERRKDKELEEKKGS